MPDCDMPDYAALMACYRSGQMSEAQMVEHERADPGFAEYARRHSRTP